MSPKASALLAAALLALTAGGCTDESVAQSEEDLAELQSRVVAETKEAIDAVDGAGLTVEEAAGIAEYCGMEPDPGVTYRSGARLAEDGDPAAQVATVRDALVDLGWAVDSESDDPQPHVSLTRDDLRASVDVSRRAGEPGVTFGITGPCLSVAEDYALPDDNRRIDIVS